MTGRSLVVSVHDVSPATREETSEILDELNGLGLEICSLLVIPDHHQRGHFLRDARFCAWLAGRASAGNEVVLHGYFHQRPRGEIEPVVSKLWTRVYTRDEGEFYDLEPELAAALVAKARAEFAELNLQITGFIAPAWLLNPAVELVLREEGFDYTTKLGSVIDLQKKTCFRSQSLVWSVRNAWRRQTSLLWNALLFSSLRANPLLRMAIHPVDRRHPAVWRQIRDLLIRALEDRSPLTYDAWVRQQRRTP